MGVKPQFYKVYISDNIKIINVKAIVTKWPLGKYVAPWGMLYNEYKTELSIKTIIQM